LEELIIHLVMFINEKNSMNKQSFIIKIVFNYAPNMMLHTMASETFTARKNNLALQ